MKTTSSGARGAPGNSRHDALTKSEKAAAEHQPDNFKDVETGEKVIEIGPDLTGNPIEGIDPPTSKIEPAASRREQTA